MALVIEEKYDQVRQLIGIGKARGYLLYAEVNDILPPEMHSSEEIDEMLSALERYGINIYEDATSVEAARDADGTDFGAVEPKEELPTENSELGLHARLGRGWPFPPSSCDCSSGRAEKILGSRTTDRLWGCRSTSSAS